MKPLLVTVNGQVPQKDPLPADASLPFAIAFPKWINRWSFLILLLCILPAAALLFGIRRPAYAELPVKPVKTESTWQFTALVSREVAGLNKVNDKVKVSTGRKDEGKTGIAGTILSVRPAANGKYELTISTGSAPWAQPRAGDGQVFATLRTGRPSMAEKIFTNQ